MNKKAPLCRAAVALACAIGVPVTQAATWDWNNLTAVWSDFAAWTPNFVPVSAPDTILAFGGTGSAGYVSTNDLAGVFSLNGLILKSTATVSETITTNASAVLGFMANGATNPTITQEGTGAFDLNIGIDAVSALAFGGTGTGLTTVSGIISGAGGLTFSGANWRLTNTGNTFTGGITVNTGAFVELAPPGALTIAPGSTSIVGSNAAANAIVINGGTIKLTTTGNITFGDNRALTFGANGGVFDVRNSGIAGAGNIFSSGTNDLALTLNNTGNNLAVLKFNGGQFGISTNTTNNGDWSSTNNSLRVESYAGTGRLRVELDNGAMFQNRAGTVNVPVTVRGVVGGDPTSGPNATVNANLSLNTGRMIFDVVGTQNFAQGLTLEGAMQLSPAGQARALDGNVTLAGGAYVAFNGRGTGTTLGAPITGPGASAADTQHPLYVGVGGNDTLTIQSGAIGVFDSRIRHEQASNNAVLLNARAVIQGGGELRIYQSLSRATAAAAASTQINTNSSTSLVAPHIIDGDIQGEGSTGSEAVLGIYLPVQAGTDTNGDQVPDSAFGDLGGVVFRNNSTGTTAGTNGSDLIINGTGFGGLRIEGRARPNLLFATGGGVADPVSSLDKVNNLLTAQRLSGLTGTGGYLTPAPLQNTYAFPLGGEWGPTVPVGLRVANSNTAGVDVSLAALGSFSHNLAVDAQAVLDLGASSPFVIGGNAVVNGRGAITTTGTVLIDAGASISPGLGDIGTLSMNAGSLTLSGGLSIGVQADTADLLAVTGDLILGGALSLSGTFGTSDLVLASYSGALAGTFSSVLGLPSVFSIDYGTGANSNIRLIYNTAPSLVWNGLPTATWSVGGGNWKNGAIYSDGNRVTFDGTAAGSTTVTISGSDVNPLEVLVNATTANYTIVSSPGAALTGAGALTKTGAMILTMMGPATYTGGTFVNAGTLALGSADALPDTGAIEIAAGATLNVQGFSDTVDNVTVNGSVTGTGILSLNSLTLGSDAAFAPSLVVKGGVTKNGATTTTLANSVDLSGDSRPVTVAAGGTLAVTGTVSNGGITKAGAGDLVLSPTAANTFLGGINVVAGRIAAATGGIPDGTALTMSSGAILDLTSGQPLVLGSLSGTGGTINGANGVTLNQTDTTTFAGSITGVTSVNMNGTGSITFSGSSSYTGGFFANNGRAILTGPAAGGTGIIRVNPNGTLGSGAALTSRVDLLGGTFFGVGSPASVASNDLVAGTGTTTTVSLSDPIAPGTRSEVIVLGTLKGSGNLSVVISSNAPHPDGGVGFRLRGTGASDFSGTISAGNSVKLEVQTGQAGPFSPAGTGKFVFTGGNFSGGLNGDYSQFNIRNNFAGNTIIGNDIEVVGTGFVNMNMAGGAGAGVTSTFGNLRIGGQTLGVNKNGGETQVLEFTSVTLTGGDPTFAPTTVGFGASGTGDLRLGPISELVPGTGITLDGATTLTLRGANTYTGPTRVNNGTLRVDAAGALPAAGSLIVNGGIVDLANSTGFNQTTGSLSGTGGTITNSDGFFTRTFEIAQAGGTTFAGNITGNLSLKKTGTGGLILTGPVTTTAELYVEGGTLHATNLVNPPVLVRNGGNVSGSGLFTTIDVGVNGLMTPGDFAIIPNPSGTLTAAEVTFALGSAMDIALAKAVAGAPPTLADYTQLKVTGQISLDNPDLDLNIGSGLEIGDLFTIILNEGPSAVTGTFFDRQNGDIFTRGGQAFQISYFDDASTPGFELQGGNDVTLMAVPEPGSAILLLGGLVIAAGRRSRRRA